MIKPSQQLFLSMRGHLIWWIPKGADLWRWGSGMRNPRWKKYRGEPARRSREIFLAVRLSRARHWWDWLRCPTGRAEWRGDFVEPRVELDGFGQFLDAEINGAAANLVAVGVGMNPV